MRVATEDERADSHVDVPVQFREYLIGIADDGAAATAAGQPDAAPQMIFEIQILALPTQGVLALHAGALGVHRPGFDLRPLVPIEFADEPVRGGPRLGLGFAN